MQQKISLFRAVSEQCYVRTDLALMRDIANPVQRGEAVRHNTFWYSDRSAQQRPDARPAKPRQKRVPTAPKMRSGARTHMGAFEPYIREHAVAQPRRKSPNSSEYKVRSPSGTRPRGIVNFTAMINDTL